MKPMINHVLKITLKFAFAIGLIFWLVNSGKLDFSVLAQAMGDPWRMLSGFALVIFVLWLGCWRYYLILIDKITVKVSFKKVAVLNWIGLFFNSVLPGNVSGDIVKIFYIKKIDPTLTKRFLLGSVLIDRFVGLFGLISILGIFSLINYSQLSSLSKDIKIILDINLALFACVIFSYLALFFFQDLPAKLLRPLKTISPLSKLADKLIDIWENLCLFRRRILMLTAISLIIQGMTVVNFWYITHPFAQGEFLFRYAFSLIPVGFVAIAIPIAPSGLGVGHAVFHQLFAFLGVSNGASLFNIYFVIMLLANLLGAIPYLLLNKGKKKKISEMEKEF